MPKSICKNCSNKERELFFIIYRNNKISRANLSGLSNIKNASFYRSINSLLEKQMVLLNEDTAHVSANLQRRPSDSLRANPKFAYSITLTIRRHRTYVSLVDFIGNNIQSVEFIFYNETSVQIFYESVKNSIVSLLSTNKVPYEKLLGIGVSVVGMRSEGYIKSLTFLDFPFIKELNLQKELSEIFNLPITVNNLVASAGMGNHLNLNGIKHSAYFFVDRGIGASSVINDETILTNGPNKGFGHMIINLDGKKCGCGSYGCIEKYASAEAILEDVRTMMKIYTKCSISSNPETLSLEDISKAIDNKDFLVIECVQKSANILCVGIINLLSVLTVNTFTLSGSVPNKIPYFFETVKKILHSNLPNCSVLLDSDIQSSIDKGAHFFLLKNSFSK